MNEIERLPYEIGALDKMLADLLEQRFRPSRRIGALKGIGSFDAHKGDEELLIRFRAVPAGSVVQNLNYDAPMAGRTSDEVRAQMTKRYGAPTLQSRDGSPISMT